MPTTSLYEHATTVPIDPVALREREATAREIALFAPAVLPDLLLTGDYARALLERDPTIPSHEITDRVAAILRRQEAVFRDGGPLLRVFVTMHALTSEAVDHDITLRQYDHLIDLVCTHRTTLTIRVIHGGYSPIDRFALLDGGDHATVYTASPVTELFLTAPGHLRTYRRVLASLDAAAWTSHDSRTFLAELTVRHDCDIQTSEQAAAVAASLGVDWKD